MNIAYVDTSVLLAVAFKQEREEWARHALEHHRFLRSAGLLEAEVRAAHGRERVPLDPATLRRVGWVHPDRALTGELERVFAAGYLRGADAWHLACALFLSPDPSELVFLTLDARQAEVARALGFREE